MSLTPIDFDGLIQQRYKENIAEVREALQKSVSDPNSLPKYIAEKCERVDKKLGRRPGTTLEEYKAIAFAPETALLFHLAKAPNRQGLQEHAVRDLWSNHLHEVQRGPGLRHLCFPSNTTLIWVHGSNGVPQLNTRVSAKVKGSKRLPKSIDAYLEVSDGSQNLAVYCSIKHTTGKGGSQDGAAGELERFVECAAGVRKAPQLRDGKPTGQELPALFVAIADGSYYTSKVFKKMRQGAAPNTQIGHSHEIVDMIKTLTGVVLATK